MVLHWFGFRLTRTIQLDINPFEYRRQIIGDLGIPEADNPISLLLKPKLPVPIALGCLVVVMMSTVEFNDEMFSWTEEVDDIGTDRRLTPEVRAVYREFSQSAPKRALVRCRVGSKSLGS